MSLMMMDGLPVELPSCDAMPDGRRDFGSIAFDKLPNTRDLGGLTTVDGRTVRRGALLRSGMLAYASDADLERLRTEYHLSLIVDLRNLDELAESPDPLALLPEARFVHANIFENARVGITQERAARIEAARRLVEESGDPVDFMVALYPAMLLDAHGIAGYRQFFEALLACEDGAALWHCQIGRDRCGMASLLVETALGVPWEQIVADYLATNVYALARFTREGPASVRSLRAVTAAVEREYGGYGAYIEKALGIEPSALHGLRSRLLE